MTTIIEFVTNLAILSLATAVALAIVAPFCWLIAVAIFKTAEFTVWLFQDELPYQVHKLRLAVDKNYRDSFRVLGTPLKRAR